MPHDNIELGLPVFALLIGCGAEVVPIAPPSLGDARSVVFQARARANIVRDHIVLGEVDRPISIDLPDGAVFDLHLLAFTEPPAALMLPEPLRIAKDEEPAFPLPLSARGWSGSFEDDRFSGWSEIDEVRIQDAVRVFDPTPDPCRTLIGDVTIESVEVCERDPVCAVTAMVIVGESAWVSTSDGRLLDLRPDGRVTPILDPAPVYTAGHLGPSGKVWLARADGEVASVSPVDGRPEESHALQGAPDIGRIEELLEEEPGALYAATSSASIQVFDGAAWSEIHRGSGVVQTVRAARFPGGVVVAGIDRAAIRIKGRQVTRDAVGIESDDSTTAVVHHEDLGTLVAIVSESLLRSAMLRFDGGAWVPFYESREPGTIRDLISVPDLYFAGGLAAAGRHGPFAGDRFCVDQSFGAFVPSRVRRFGDAFLFLGREAPLLMPIGPPELRIVRRR